MPESRPLHVPSKKSSIAFAFKSGEPSPELVSIVSFAPDEAALAGAVCILVLNTDRERERSMAKREPAWKEV